MLSTSLFLRVVVVAATLMSGLLILSRTSRAEILPPREPLIQLPLMIDDWAGRREPDLEDDIVAILGVDDHILRTYTRQGDLPIGLYIGYHDSQRQGDTIHSPLNCIPGAGWQPVDQSRVIFDVKGAPGARDATAPVEVNRVVIEKGLERQLVLYWYQSHRRVVASEYTGKVYTVLDAVRYNRTDAALVRIITPVLEGDPFAQAAERRAVAFAQSLFPSLDRHLPS